MLSNLQVFLLQMQKLLTFFQQKISVYAIFDDKNFNDTLTNDIVSFEQPGPDIQDGHLEILQTTSPPKQWIGLSQNLMGGIEVTKRLRIAKSFCSNVQDGCQGGHLENLQTTSAS